MSSDDVSKLLHSSNASERLAAMRALLSADGSNYLEDVRKARLKESDSWVQAAMDKVLFRWQNPSARISSTTEESGDTPGTRAEIYAQATQEVTRTILHELKPLVGNVEISASLELKEVYEKSQLFADVSRVRELLAIVEKLHAASAAPRAVEFDLVDHVSRCIALAGFNSEEVKNNRSDVQTVTGDPDLLALALINGIRNAVEAGQGFDTAAVVVNCAVTDIDAWVAVLDQGIGLPEGFDGAYTAGATTKSKIDHFGWGLTIAQSAVASLGGTIRLAPRQGGGTSYEIRWKQ